MVPPMRPFCLLVVFCLLSVLPAVAQTEIPGDTRYVEQAGTIRMHGCAVTPSDILLRARPLPVRGPAPSRPAVPGSPATRMARITFADDGSETLRFLLSDLIIGQPYRLGIQLHTKRCGKVFFQTSDDGIVIAGLSDPVIVDGYAVRSELEVLGQVVGGREAPKWVGADHLDFTDPQAAVRTFRWKPNQLGVAAGQLQVSNRPFPMPGRRASNPCEPPPLLHTQNFAVNHAGWTSVPPVDFNRILLRGRTDDGRTDDRLDDGGEGVSPEILEHLEMGAPLYVRVMPLSVDGQPICDVDAAGVPSMVILAKLLLQITADTPPPPDPTLKLVYASYTPPAIWNHPKWDETCYRVTKSHYLDPATLNMWMSGYGFLMANPKFSIYNYWLWVKGGAIPDTTVPEGKRFCVAQSKSDDGWFESFVSDLGSVVTGFVDAVAQLVNYASYLWEKIQDAVVEVAAGAIQAVGIPCDSTCKAALEYGLETGLAAMGVPPSIPNFEQLMDQGLDYVAAEVAAQTGVPPEVADLATDKAKEFVKEAAKQMKANQKVPGLPDWLAPEVGLDPAILTLHVQGNGTAFSARPGLILNSNPIFLGSPLLKLPKKLPVTPQNLAVPMVLQPDLSGLPVPPGWKIGWQTIPYDDYHVALWNKEKWVQQRLSGACVKFHVTGLVPGDIFKLMSVNLEAEGKYFFIGPNYSDCTP